MTQQIRVTRNVWKNAAVAPDLRPEGVGPKVSVSIDRSFILEATGSSPGDPGSKVRVAAISNNREPVFIVEDLFLFKASLFHVT
jgi:hypothetical protein